MGGQVKYVSDAYVVNENYSKIKQAQRGLTRWSKGSFECMLRFIGITLYNLLRQPYNPCYWHVFCRLTSLSKAMQLVIMTIALGISFCFGGALGITFSYSLFFTLISVMMGLNLAILETLVVLRPEHTWLASFKIIMQTYVFSLFYQLCNIRAVLTFWHRQWVVSEHGKNKS